MARCARELIEQCSDPEVYQNILDPVTANLIGVEHNGKICFASQQALRHLGSGRDHVLGQDAVSLLGPGVQPLLTKAAQADVGEMHFNEENGMQAMTISSDEMVNVLILMKPVAATTT